MNCRVFYRISSESYKKTKLPGATKERCLENFIQVFGKQIILLADNCHIPLLDYLKKTGIPCLETNLGNAKSFRHALHLACRLEDETLVYFVEDDYLHLAKSPPMLEEGIQHADYVTVYDHPDKYGPFYNNGETSKVIRTPSSHWRYSVSTTMTFAARVKTLKEDIEIWEKHTEGDHPGDHSAFQELQGKGRKLLVSVPGAACHADMTYSLEMGCNLIEPWAIELLIKGITKNIFSMWDGDAEDTMVELEKKNLEPLKHLTLLYELETATKKKKASKP